MFNTIDEFRSSCVCNCCLQKNLTNMKAISKKRDRDGKIKETPNKVSIHKILHCRTSVKTPEVKGCGRTCNRDVNASLNLLTLTVLQLFGVKRPKVFSRPPTTKVKKKVIKNTK